MRHAPVARVWRHALLACWASLAASLGVHHAANTSRAFFVDNTPACEIAPGIRTDCMHASTCDCFRECERMNVLGLPGEMLLCFQHTRTATSTLEDVLASPLVFFVRTHVITPGAFSVAEEHKYRGEAWAPAAVEPHQRVMHPQLCPRNCSMHGWCRDEQPRLRCQCFYDWIGEHCETPRPWNPCINNCLGWGECVEGVCACKPGRHGVDCSLPLLHRDAADSPLRPRIFVYELPPSFNVWREMVAINRNPSYLLWERLLVSPYRTARAQDADFFLLPVGPMGSVSHGLPMVAADYVRDTFPYWNASGGKDHLIVWPWDFGACWTSRHPSVRDTIAISHYGLVNTSTQSACKCDLCGPSYVPGKDLLIPSTLEFNFMLKTPYRPGAPQPIRSIRLFFSGKPTGNVRRRILELDTHNRRDVQITQEGVDLGDAMLRSIFCIGAPGAGYGTRAVLAVIMGCIPVTVDDTVLQPWDAQLEWANFSIHVKDADLDRLLEIVDAVPEAEIKRMQAELACAWRFFTWSSLWGSIAGEDGSSDAFEMLMYALREHKEFGKQRRKLGSCETVPDGLKPPRPLCEAGKCPNGLAPTWPHGGAAALAAATGRERKADLEGR
jgi:hypothetical protein